MRSIEAGYRKVQGHKQNLGSYLCLASVVKSKKFSRKSLVKAFKELMPKDEYLVNETKELVDYLEYLSRMPEEGEIEAKNALKTH